MELSLDGFDFSDGFKCSDVQKFEKLIILRIKIFQLFFIKIKTIGKKLILIVNSKKKCTLSC